jgi:selenocysteine lyase/cysteine desulfurase
MVYDRRQFPITSNRVYLNAGWSGPSATAVVEAMKARAEREAYDGATSPDVRHEKANLVRGTRERAARLIGADVDEVALTYTTTEGMNTVLRGLGLGPGDEVLTCNLEHNAVMVPAYYARLREGFSLQIVRFPSADETASSILDTIEQSVTAATKLLVLSHVAWNRGTRLPLRAIAELAHARGALVCVDAAQSAGHVEFNVRDLDCDFLAFPGHKWLLGPDGAAFFHVRRSLIERLEPLAVVHGANRNYDYKGHFEYASDSIHKFELTTHSGPVLAGLTAALDAAVAVGMSAVETHCLALADQFVAGLRDIDGVRVTTPLDRSVRSGIITFQIHDHNPHQIVAALWAADNIVMRVCNDSRVRACFAAYNDASDVARALTGIERIASDGIPTGTPAADLWTATMRDGED